MKILSLFDGMACGALAMQAAGVEIEKYIAYEVDKYAIQTAQYNFPFIEERGDVFKADFTEYRGFDYLIGGSPCTYWSIAQTKNRETVASGMGWELFSQYVRALHEAKPRFFLYENNKSMSAAIRASITETFGFEPILINSALVSAQNRQRLYWCGIRQADGTYKKADIQQPADRGILLKDILETNAQFNVMNKELKSVENKDAGIIGILDMAGQDQIKRVYGTNGKCATLTTCQGGHREPKVFEKIAEPVQPLTEKEMFYMVRDHQDQRWSFCNKPGQEDKSKCLVANVAKGVPYNILAEPVCLRYERTEQAKKLPKHYENHELSELHPRPDGGKNTLSTVQKDNMILELANIKKNGKARTLTASYYKYAPSDSFKKANPRMGVIEPVICRQVGRNPENPKSRVSGLPTIQMFEPRLDQKAGTLTTVTKDNLVCEPLNADEVKYCNDKNIAHICRPFGSKAKVITEDEKAPTLMAAMGTGGGNGVYYAENMKVREITNAPIYEVKDGFITVKGNKYPIKLVDGFYIIRKLTVRECMRLQTVPEWYKWPVSKSQAYKMLGNGWTVEVIAHLLRGLK